MTPDQAETIVARLAATFRARLSNGVRATWIDAISDLDPDAANAAVDHLARTEARMPSIAAVRQAAAGHTPDPGDWQVIVAWTTPDGRTYVEPRRWHHTEADARADYANCVAHWPDAATWSVELLHHHPNRPVEHIDATQCPKLRAVR